MTLLTGVVFSPSHYTSRTSVRRLADRTPPCNSKTLPPFPVPTTRFAATVVIAAILYCARKITCSFQLTLQTARTKTLRASVPQFPGRFTLPLPMCPSFSRRSLAQNVLCKHNATRSPLVNQTASCDATVLFSPVRLSCHTKTTTPVDKTCPRPQ